MFFKVQCFPRFHDKTRSRVWSSVPLLNGNSRSEHMNLNILAATVRSFKMHIDYTLDLTPPSPLAPNPSLKRKRRRRNCFKIPTCTGPCRHCKNPSKFFRLHLGTNFLSFDWDLLAFSFSNLFLFSSSSPPPPPPMLLLKSSHPPKQSKES